MNSGPFRIVAPIVASLLAAACSPVPSPPPRQGDLVVLEFDGARVVAEVVFDDTFRRKGLMHRRQLPVNRGMLFVYPRPERLGFWMKNTLIPLSIAFIDDEGKVLQIEDMKPEDLSTTRSKYYVRYALEVNQGWFQEAGIGVGSEIRQFPETVSGYTAAARGPVGGY